MNLNRLLLEFPFYKSFYYNVYFLKLMRLSPSELGPQTKGLYLLQNCPGGDLLQPLESNHQDQEKLVHAIIAISMSLFSFSLCMALASDN